jgi:hypothetical protein
MPTLGQRLHYFVFSSLLLIAACKRSAPADDLHLLAEPDLLARLHAQQTAIDSFSQQHPDRTTTFAQLVGHEELVQIDCADAEQLNIDRTFMLLKDSTGKILAAYESPYSESGDWNILYTHYFDSKGKTFAFSREASFFNSICTEGIAVENMTKWYTNQLNMVDSSYTLRDEEAHDLAKDSCQFAYDYAYTIYPELTAFLKANKLDSLVKQ